MELVFTIFAGLGALLIIFGYLGFVFAGFRHHFVTGVISALPILNIVTVPALWQKAGKKVITSLFGIIIITASWFLGANTGIQKYIGILKNNDDKALFTINSASPTSSTTTNSVTQNLPAKVSSRTNSQSILYSIDDGKVQQLPKKAIYKMSFEAIPVDNLASLKNRIVRIVTKSGDLIEGRITNVTSSSIIILKNELPIANIKKISLMVKKSTN